ncbi:MAG TPA: pantetheine-phosphate adenylyltransferase [Candidatus Eisenbacteria bacterium]|jgi:pantetheine-phosphate adenylyltransferase|nr:pantetheine-phosphate adenylyltransferase [Candidatus Eisenbacteria bacterium]
MKKLRRGVYPGTFDPVTFGHIDLIRRAVGVFDEVIVAVAHHSVDKSPLFSVPERVELLKRAVRGMRGVTVEDFEGLVVDYARRRGATAMVRGLRMLSDFEYEFQMALTNRKLAADIETIFLMPHESYSYISSRHVKEVAVLKGDIRAFAPKYVVDAVRKKYGG